MAFAELGLTEKEFFSMPPFRTYLMQMQYNRTIERKWEQTRLIAMMVHNASPNKKHNIKPSQIIRLSFDDKRNTKHPEWTKEEANELLRKWHVGQKN